MEYSGMQNIYISTAGDSGTGDSSSSTCYGGVCMPACSQMVLDRWLLIFGLFLVVWLYVFVCFFLYSICMCLLVFFVFVFLVFLWWWNLHASVLADGPGQVALDIWFVCLWMFFFVCLFLCSCAGLCWLACVVGGIWEPVCWQMILVRLCFLAPVGGSLFLTEWTTFKFRIWTLYLSFSAWFWLPLSKFHMDH